MKKLILKAVSAVICCLIICFSFASCADPLRSTKEEQEIVMTVGDYEVPYEFYRYLVLNFKTEVTKDEKDWEDADKAAEMSAEIEKKVEDSLKTFYAVFDLAKQYGVYTDNKTVSAAIDATMKATRNGYENDEAYLASLAEGYMNHSVFLLMQTNNICSEELYYKMINDGAIKADDEFINSYIYGDGFIRVKQILILGENSVKVSDGTVYAPEESHTDEEAKKLALEAMVKAKAGVDFDSLVNEYGESFYMFSNKDGYYICRGEWDEINEEAVFALQIDEVSDVIESDKGFSVFKRLEKDDAYIKTHFDELSDKYTKAQYAIAVEEKSAELQMNKTEKGKALNIADIKWEEEEK